MPEHPLLYKSTYSGENDSDEDALHITKPFEHDQDLHHRILHDQEFESDESFCGDVEDKDERDAKLVLN